MQTKSSPIRICLVIHSLKGGGMERVMSLLANNFSEKNNTEVHIVLIGINRRIDYPLSNSVVVHRPSFTFNNRRRMIDTLRTMMFLRAKIKSIRPDTILSFGEMWNSMVLLSLKGLSYPVYVSDRSQPEKDLGKMHNMLRAKLYPKAAGFIAQTEKSKEICVKNGWNRNVTVIGNPIRVIHSDDSVKKENIVLTVDRFIPTKHVDHLIEIFASIAPKNWKLIIVGGDVKGSNLSAEFQEKINAYNMEDKIFLEGQQNSDPYFKRSKLFAFTSSSEGFPNVIGEALSGGIPVVSYDCVAGPSDLIDDGENGFLIELFNKELFKEKLMLLMNDDDLRSEMSRKAKKSISKFEADKIAEEFYFFITGSK